MDSIRQARVKSGHLLHGVALVQSQRKSTVDTSFAEKSLQINKCSYRRKLNWDNVHISALEKNSHVAVCMFKMIDF
jgi:hypothetical protein